MWNLYPVQDGKGTAYGNWYYYLHRLCKCNFVWLRHQLWREHLAQYHATGVAGVSREREKHLDPNQFNCYIAAWEVQYVGSEPVEPPKFYGQLKLF